MSHAGGNEADEINPEGFVEGPFIGKTRLAELIVSQAEHP
jgi:hypothetical protein